jgi:aquaporin Z
MDLRKYAVEFIGTFFLVLTIGCTVRDVPLPFAPIAIGSILMVMIFAGGHISGAHYNPAVTLGVWIRGRCTTLDMGIYMGVQFLAALIAAGISGFLEGWPKPAPGELDAVRSLIAEFLFTFALVYVVLNSATAKGTSGNSFYGLAIGFTVLAGAYAVGPISGAAFNPAVALGVCTLGAISFTKIWIYWLATFAGGALAGISFVCLNPDDK